MNHRRYNYLDILKGIAIFLVCMYHFWYGSDYSSFALLDFLQEFLYPILSTCVPLFFTVNGALLLNKKTFDGKKHLKKIVVFFLQYCVWHGLTLIILGLCNQVDFSSFRKYQLINVFLFLGNIEGIKVNHFWFIPVFCCIYLLYPFFRELFQKEHLESNARVSLMGLLAVIYFCNFLVHDFEIFKSIFPCLNNLTLLPVTTFEPFNYQIGTMLVYFFTGGFLHKYLSQKEKISLAGSIFLVLAGLTLSYAAVCTKDRIGDVDYDCVFDGYNTTGTFLCTVGLFISAFKAEKYIPSEGGVLTVARTIGCNTMTVYYTHWFFGIIIEELIPMGYGFLWNIFHAGMLVVSGTLLGEILKRIPGLKYLIHGS